MADANVKAAKALVNAARMGDLAAIEKSLTEIERSAQALQVQQRNTREGWSFDAARYVRSGAYLDELKVVAADAGLTLHEQNGRIFSYPVLLRILESDIALTIDRKKTRTMRPSYLAALLKKANVQPPKFRVEPFLKALYAAYGWAGHEEGRTPGELRGPTLELAKLYEILVLFPGQAKEYSRQEFARDLYLLDSSGVRETAGGFQFSLHASTGTRGNQAKLFEIVDRDGARKTYYAISFRREQ